MYAWSPIWCSMIAKQEATDLNHDDDTSSRANVEIYRNFRSS